MDRILRRIHDRKTEVGGRTFVYAASAPSSSHGDFQSDEKNQNVERWVDTDVEIRTQEKVFE